MNHLSVQSRRAMTAVVIALSLAGTSRAQFPRISAPSNLNLAPPSYRGPSLPRPGSSPAMIDWYQLHHQAATTRPFPNATLRNYPYGQGRIAGRIPYEIGVRNQTVSDMGITAAGIAAGAQNPILGGAALPYARDSAFGYGAKGLYKKAYEQPRPPSYRPGGGFRDPNTYIMSGQAPRVSVPRSLPRIRSPF